jgi:hypothetical protein
LKTWRILFTDYRRPLKTFKSSFCAAIGLYFFKKVLDNPQGARQFSNPWDTAYLLRNPR